MSVVTIHRAKTELSKLLKAVEAGEKVVIARGKKPIAIISPAEDLTVRPRVPGRWKGRISLPDPVFAGLSEAEMADWEGAYESPF